MSKGRVLLTFLLFVLPANVILCNDTSTVLSKHSNIATSPKNYIHPSLTNYIDAPLPEIETSDQVVGIYGNIFYPQDQEQMQQRMLNCWIETYSKDPSAPFSLSSDAINEISLFILDRFPLKTISLYFFNQVKVHLRNNESLESALEHAKEESLIRANLYKEMAQNIPIWNGRCEILKAKFIECSDQAERIIDQNAKIIRDNPTESLQSLLKQTSIDLIEPPFTWDIRIKVFKQMIDKIMSVSPNSAYFLALQEVTPQALRDLKTTLADKNLQWISFNNISKEITLEPGQEKILGEATGFTSTFALSNDLQILKIELGDLPNESGSIRKILGIRVCNTHTNEVFNLFTTHTDHKIQNDIYARTAKKIHEFATQFFQDAPTEQRFILGGDLNAFEQSDGDQYLEKLHDLFFASQDFRETNYYAPYPIAWSSFIGRFDDTYSGRIAKDGLLEPNALDHILVGNGVVLQSAAKEAAVYNDSGKLLDYYEEKDNYIKNLQNRLTFSDHFFNIVRFN